MATALYGQQQFPLRKIKVRIADHLKLMSGSKGEVPASFGHVRSDPDSGREPV
jgi:hypothetical protein